MLRKKYTPGAYDKCVVCKFRGHGCDGPRTSGMMRDRHLELCRDVKDYEGYTNSYIAERTTLSLKTVESFFSGKIGKDLRFSTVCEIEGVLFGSSGTYPCPLELMDGSAEGLIEIQKELEQTKKQLEDERAAHKAEKENAEIRLEHLRGEVKYLREMLDKAMSK